MYEIYGKGINDNFNTKYNIKDNIIVSFSFNWILDSGVVEFMNYDWILALILTDRYYYYIRVLLFLQI